MRRALMVVVLGAVVVGAPRNAHAFIFHDGPAFAQRILQWWQNIQQFRQMVRSGKDNLHAIEDAYRGAKNWRNMGWLDTLKVLDSPWLDSVKGIDNIRLATTASVMTVEQATKLWGDLQFDSWKRSPRYRRDGWYRAQVDSLSRQSTRARAQRAALLRQLQSQNLALMKDVDKIKRLRDEIESENKSAAAAKRPANQALIASLQAELSATEAKYQGENMMLVNQRAIMFLVGSDDAYASFLETTKSDWLEHNNRSVLDFGRGFGK
jgi:hypothetical protein